MIFLLIIHRSMSFGWHRAEVIGATVSVLMIWVVTGVLVSCTFVTYSGDPKPETFENRMSWYSGF